MRILVMTFRLPDKLDTGDKLTMHHFLKYFSKEHEIYFMCLTALKKNSINLDLIEPYCTKIKLFKLSQLHSLFNSAIGLFSQKPLQMHYYFSHHIQKKIVKSVHDFDIDLVYGYHLRTSQYISNISKCPKVLDLKPVQILNMRRMKENVSSPVKKAIYALEYKRVKKYETSIIKTMDKCFVISNKDKSALEKESYFDNLIVNPHGVDSNFFKPNKNFTKNQYSLVFSGNMGYEPNVDAIIYFYNEIYPLIKNEIPEIKLYIVGNRPSPKIMSIGNKDISVSVTGYVDDIRPYLNRATIGIDPLRMGAGLQNKVLEGMSMGLPMIITSIANEGIGAEHQKNVLVCDQPFNFAQAVIFLLKNEKLLKDIGKCAREFILQKWSWESHFSDMECVFKDIIQC